MIWTMWRLQVPSSRVAMLPAGSLTPSCHAAPLCEAVCLQGFTSISIGSDEEAKEWTFACIIQNLGMNI